MKDVTKLDYKECKYRVVECTLIFSDGSKHEFNPDYDVGEIILEKNYDSYQYPFMLITLNISGELNKKMRYNNDNLKLRLSMRYAMFKKGVTSIDQQNIEEHPFINDTFYMYFDDSSAYPYDDLAKIIDADSQFGSNNPDITNMQTAAELKCILYKEDAITNPKSLFSDVITGVTVTDAITYLLMNAGVNTKILMSPSTNGRRYGQFIIPPLRIDEGLERIANDYALHDNGSTLFFDYDRLYIIEKINRCTAWEPNEPKTVYVAFITSTYDNTHRVGAYIDEEDNEIYLTGNGNNSATSSIHTDEVMGSGLQVINKKTGKVSYYAIDGDKISVVPNNKRLMYNRTIVINTGDANTINALKERLNEKTITWSVYLDSTMLSELTPNKEFRFVFPDSSKDKYNGSYRLVDHATLFQKTGGDADPRWMTIKTVATFCGKATS